MAYVSTFAFQPTAGSAAPATYAPSLDTLSTTQASDTPTAYMSNLFANKILYRNAVPVDGSFNPSNIATFGEGIFDAATGAYNIVSPHVSATSDITMTLYEPVGGAAVNVVFQTTSNTGMTLTNKPFKMPPQGAPLTVAWDAGNNGWTIGQNDLTTGAGGVGFGNPVFPANKTNFTPTMDIVPRRVALASPGVYTVQGPKGQRFRWYLASGSL